MYLPKWSHFALCVVFVRSSCDVEWLRFCWWAISSSSGVGFQQDPYCNIYHPHQQQFFIRIHIAISIILISSRFFIRINIAIFIILISSISRRASLEIAAGVVFISGPGCYLEYLWHFLWPGRAIIIINIFGMNMMLDENEQDYPNQDHGIDQSGLESFIIA